MSDAEYLSRRKFVLSTTAAAISVARGGTRGSTARRRRSKGAIFFTGWLRYTPINEPP
jgi:hypothetical protein